MKKQAKRWIGFTIQVLLFVLLSALNIYLIVRKHNNDMILLYAIACFFFVYWMCGFLLPKGFLKLQYKLFRKPMEKSMTLEFMGERVADEHTAHKTLQKTVRIFPYIYFGFLGCGILLLLLL